MPNMEELRAFYKDFLDELVENGMSFFEDTNRDALLDWCDNNSHDLDFYYANGATKMVFWEDEYPYVIKFPFLDENHARDYCKQELANYQAAQKDYPEIVDCFAWCDYLFEYCGFPIYIMEKVDCDEATVSERAYSAAYNTAKDERFIKDDDEDFDEEFSNEFYDWSGDEQTEPLLYEEWNWKVVDTFLEFCSIRDINDRHTANWGYRGSQLVIIDYSGF